MSAPSVPVRLVMMCIASEAMFFIPVAIAYYQMKGADLGTFIFLQGLFRMMTFALEIPTGFLADKWSRPHQLIASRALWVASVAVLYFADNVPMLLLHEAISPCRKSPCRSPRATPIR